MLSPTRRTLRNWCLIYTAGYARFGSAHTTILSDLFLVRNREDVYEGYDARGADAL